MPYFNEKLTYKSINYTKCSLWFKVKICQWNFDKNQHLLIFCHFSDMVKFSIIFSFSDTHLWVIFLMGNRQTHSKILQKGSQVVVDDP